ncbi:hypothetical protein FNV43_RR08717 [Rhamnella rubrinervis]|uniref:DUF1985 domain-containing protein n=1 Tax=Rhamnella rubrinervis TaxID=2594499 RepID=A0A8K0MJ20_9ROSA|nr:hypothetical protein FNV43_RR08717 [Rhamnella rubrinervis]
MNSYVRMFADNAIYSAKVTIKSYLNSAINTIKEKLSTTQLGMFEKTCFGHFLDMQELHGRKFSLHNHDIVEVVSTTTCENDDDMVKLVLLYFLETVILSKEKPTPIPVERVDMLDDIKYFLTYPWSTLSYDATVKSMCGCPGKRSNASHTYSITGFPIAFMVWGYETIPSLAEAFGIKSSLPRCPRMRNWTISGMPKKKILEDIFSGRGYEVVGIMVPKVHELPLVATVHHAGGQKPGDAAPVVEDASGVDLDADRGNSVEDRLCAMEKRLSSIDSRQSFIDSRLSSIDRKLDCLIKLLGGTYNTSGLDEDADQCFDEVGVQDISVGDVHRTCDQRTDHAVDNIVGPMSISSSPIVESKYSMKQYMEARLDLFNKNKSNYDFGEEMLEFLNGKEPMMKIKPCWEYDRVKFGIVQFIGEVLPKFL